MMCKLRPTAFFWFTALALFCAPVFAVAGGETSDCDKGEDAKIKLEGFISKQFKSEQRTILKEFEEPGNVRAELRAFPMGDTSKVIAIGHCVPARVARHVLAKALKYTAGVDFIVQPQVILPYWIGVGSTAFDEPSHQKVTSDQVQQLLDEKLSTAEFHALYRKFAVPNEEVHFYGTDVPNIKRIPEKKP